jgi:hypothetical protein
MVISSGENPVGVMVTVADPPAAGVGDGVGDGTGCVVDTGGDGAAGESL